MTDRFKSSIIEALSNQNLTGALGRFSEAYRISRQKAYEGINFEELRQTIARIKGDAASRQKELVSEFKIKAEARGAKVFVTNNPQAVKEYILDVATKNNVRSIVKSKSMASEEIHLNEALKSKGMDVQETDLGEWIIQLAGQRPSHMVLPAIHMTKEEVADLFSKEVNERLTSDIPRLVKTARKQLREKFLNADMGISGANIAIAETGSIVLLTNEGNARLVTTLPKIHIAIIGIEKLVPKVSDIVPIIKALPRSATGQLITSYVSVISGDTPNIDGDKKEIHFILMDNRRSEMAQDGVFKQALQCIRCASCLNVCPVFRLVGGHVFGDVYTGGIGTILTAWFGELKRSKDIQSLCIQCGNCKEVCPAKIDIPELILEIRKRLIEQEGLSFTQKAIFKIVNNRKLFHRMLRMASLAQKPFEKDGYIRHLPMFLSGLADFRSLPAISDTPFRDKIKSISQPQSTKTVVFYGGCLIDFAYPHIGESVVKVLNKAGYKVLFPEGQTCCGAPARYSGDYDTARQNAIDNIDALLSENSDYIISACPTCTAALKKEFLELLKGSMYEQKALILSHKSWDLSSFITRLKSNGELVLDKTNTPQTITYHDSCHLKRTLNVFDEPRQLLREKGYEIKEMFESDMCCGMGGSYSIKFPEISKPILTKKLKNITDTGAKAVVMDCPGCVMQIKGGLDKLNSDIKVYHTVELL
ncbi:MAG: LUD domain-containing protein [Thermodesulfovibrionales bacterium]|nr:LUD domain-containing protein [Thermodesulfovibrionales bacterium]